MSLSPKTNYLAFTLAEVLITLGIIGVVAALTIPVLVMSYQKQECKTGFKKAYANLFTAYNSVTYDNGGTPYDCYYTSAGGSVSNECDVFWSELKTKLKVVKTYDGAVDGINAPDYLGTELLAAQGGVSFNSFCNGGQTSLKFDKEVWTLADGSMIMSYVMSTIPLQIFILDTNGMRKPNKWGYDIFMLDFKNISTDSYKISIEDNQCGAIEKNGYRVSDIILN